MRLVKGRRLPAAVASDPYAGLVRVHTTPCYDVLVSLRALHNPRTYERTRAWAAATKGVLDSELHRSGRFFFQGHDTCLGYGASRLVAELPAGAGPDALIGAIRVADPRVLALYMVDTGETDDRALTTFREYLDGDADGRAVDRALRGVHPDWARRCRRALSEPLAAREELASLLERYVGAAFGAEIPHVTGAITPAAKQAEELLAVLPSVAVIERLAGGYTLSPDLSLRRITLAPSIFIYPFMASRVDERAGEALIIFGVRSDALLKFDPVPVDPDLLRAVKALADPGRMKVMRLLGRRPMIGPELVSTLGLSQPTVHHHLHQLRAAGLVRQERTKGGMQYTIRRESAAAVLEALARLISGKD